MTTTTTKLKLIMLFLMAATVGVNGDNISLSWDPSPGADGYKLYQSINSGPFNLVASAVGTSTVTTVSQPSQFYVTAYNAGGESAPSNVVAYTPVVATPANIVLPSPAIDKLKINPGQSIIVTATIQNTGDGSYNLTVGNIVLLAPGATRENGPYIYIAPIPAQTVRGKSSVQVIGTWSAPAGAVLGDYQVYSVINDGSANWLAGPSTVFKVEAAVIAPVAPTNLRANPISASRIDLNWTAPENTEQVVVERKLSSASSFSIFATVPATQSFYVNTGLQRDKVYDFRTRGKTGTVLSAYSPTISARTLKR